MGIFSMAASNSCYIVCPFCGERVHVHKCCTNCGRKYSKKKMRALLKKYTTLSEDEIDKVLDGYGISDDIILPNPITIFAERIAEGVAAVAQTKIDSTVCKSAVSASEYIHIKNRIASFWTSENQRKESQNENIASTFFPSDSNADIHFVNSSIFAL